MEVSQNPGRVDDPPGHRWARVLGTGVAVITLTLPVGMIAAYPPLSSNAQSVPQIFKRTQQIMFNLRE